jgi:hypothetical protein
MPTSTQVFGNARSKKNRLAIRSLERIFSIDSFNAY